MSKTAEDFWRTLARRAAEDSIKNGRDAAIFELFKALSAVIEDLQDLQQRVTKLEYDAAKVNPVGIVSSPN